MSEKQRYPLSWPTGWKRTASEHRVRARFGNTFRGSAEGMPRTKGRLSIEDAFDRIEEELQRFGVDTETVIVSTNLKLNMRGIPSGNQGEPSDPGAAVYWTRKSSSQCMAIDAYTRVADNLAAVAATLWAMRAIERHGGAQILERAFIGFAQLAERRDRPWREVLEFGTVTPTKQMVEDKYRALAKLRHPDVGGSHGAFSELARAREEALLEV